MNKRQCKRLAERFEAVRESLTSAQKQVTGLVYKTHRYNIGTLLKRGKALVIKYQNVATIVTSVIKWRCNREAFKEIHKDIDNLKWELDLETFYANKPGSFELITGEERERVLERDAEEDKKMMLQELKDLHINGLDLTTLELVVDEKPQGKVYWPGYLVIEPSKIQIMTREYHRPHESSSDADQHLEVVYRGKWLNCDFHLKEFKCSELDWNMEQMRKEVDSLIKLRHPHLIQLVGFAHDEHNCFVLMELMERESLRHLLNCQNDSLAQNPHSLSIRHRPFSFHETIDIIHQIAKGVLFLHKKGYVHGELKCSNIFIKESDGVFDVKIANFHCFRHLGKKSTTENTVSHQPAGSAPEATSDYNINNGEPTDFLLQKGDVYSFGMTCYEIMTGILPITDVSGRELVENIKRGFRPEDVRKDTRDTLVAIVKKCWDPIPANRPDFDTICHFLGMKWQASEFRLWHLKASPNFVDGWMMHKEPEVMHKEKQRRVSIHIANKLNFPQYLRIDPMDLEPMRSIGEGSEVFSVQWLGCTFAAKQFQSTINIQSVQEELQFLMELMHPHIVRLVGFCHNVESDRCAIVMEYMETDLNKLIDRDFDTLHQALNIIAQISLGMSYLHSHGIIHGDLKPSKVLVHDDGDHMHIKIAHFGLSQYTSEPPKRDVETSIWRAPEVLQGLMGSTDKAQPYITQASDVYSFGAVCYLVLTGRRPIKEEMRIMGVRNLDKSMNDRFGPFWQDESYEHLKNLLNGCLHPNPKLRPSSRSICEKLTSIIKGRSSRGT